MSLQRTIVNKEKVIQRTTPPEQYQKRITKKDFNKNNDTSNTAPPQARIYHHRPKVNSVIFEYPYESINPMGYTHKYNNLIDTQEQDIENSEVEKEELFEDKNENLITEEELEHIHAHPNQKFPYPTMKTGLITVHHNDPEDFIDNPEYFSNISAYS